MTLQERYNLGHDEVQAHEVTVAISFDSVQRSCAYGLSAEPAQTLGGFAEGACTFQGVKLDGCTCLVRLTLYTAQDGAERAALLAVASLYREALRKHLHFRGASASCGNLITTAPVLQF